MDCPTPSREPSSDALRAWMGYSNSHSHALFGEPGQRGPMLEYCLGKLRRHWGNDFEFTNAQMNILQAIVPHFARLLCRRWEDNYLGMYLPLGVEA